VNEWTQELEDHAAAFTKQAVIVANNDRMIIENADRIYELYSEVQRVQVAGDELEHNLSMIQSQQSQLHNMLEEMEREAEKLKAEKLTNADVERDKGYKQAEEVSSQLDQMSLALRDLVKSLNDSQEAASDRNNPMHAIRKVLNEHLTSLQRIDKSSALLQSKIHDLGKLQAEASVQQDRLLASRGNFY